MLGWFKRIFFCKNIRLERGYLGLSMVLKIPFFRVCMVKFPLDRVYVRHKWRSGCDVVEMGFTDIGISWLVMGNGGKIVIVKNGINY